MAPLFQSLGLLSLGTLILITSFLLEFMDLTPDKTVLQRAKIFPDTTEFPLWLNKKGLWKIYIFNTTNPHEVSYGEKPVLKETGPYTYEEIISKTNINFNPKPDTVSYRTFAVQKYMRDLSKGSERDVLFVPILQTTAETGYRRRYNFPYYGQMIPNFRPQPENFEKVNARSVLGGMYVPMVKDTSSILSYNVRLGPFNMFNHVGKSNEIQVGREDQHFKDIGRLVKWMGQPDLAVYHDRCNYMNGTDGKTFSPNVDRQAVLHVFLPYLHRSVYFKYTKDTFVNGIRAYRFDLATEAFQYPGENICYCKIFNRRLTCPLDGTFQLDLSPRWKYIMSLPHFLHASTQLRNQFDALAPERGQHGSYIELEPSSGLVLSAHYRFQLNVVLRPSVVRDGYGGGAYAYPAPVMVFPVMWWDYQYSDLVDPAVKNAMLDIGTEPVSSSLGSYKWLVILFGFNLGLGGLILFYFQVVQEEYRAK